MTPYIGITGFTTAAEVSEVVRSLPPTPDRLLMCGVLLSNALLSGAPSDALGRCPPPDAIASIFSDDPRCLNLVHYRPRAGTDLVEALTRATAIGGPNCHGLQINATRGAPWPNPRALQEYRDRCQPKRIVLQVGGEAMELAEGHPREMRDGAEGEGSGDPGARAGNAMEAEHGEEGEGLGDPGAGLGTRNTDQGPKIFGPRPQDVIARRCAAYEGIITDALIDASEGMGVPLDAARSAEYLSAVAEAAPTLGLVVAGGLHAGNLASLLSPLLPSWSHVSIDAEGRLRDNQDRLSIPESTAYLAAALELLAP